MKENENIFSSESVTEGHPDKVCDQISDAILDSFLKKDPNSRVACETMIMPGKVIVAGEVSSQTMIDYQEVIRRVLHKTEYTKNFHGLSADDFDCEINIVPQSEDISVGVDRFRESRENLKIAELGAGDQGIMHGYATNENSAYFPSTILFSHMLVRKLDDIRKNKKLDYLLSDGKAQVSMAYSKDNKPLYCKAITLSAQHLPEVSIEKLYMDLFEQVILEVIPTEMIKNETKILINPTGRFVTGGAKADCGLTGRKVIVDTYGGFGRHGGGAFSGKDPSKVDRSGAYMARYIAKNLVASGICKRVDVQLAYAIGVAKPVGVFIDTFKTGKIPDYAIASNVNKTIELTPLSIISRFNLLRPIYEPLAVYGQVGRKDLDLPWEEIDYKYFGM